MTPRLRRVALLLATALLATPASAPAQSSASLGYTVSRFDSDLDPWHQLTLETLRREGWGTVLARANLARRFGETGEQLEVEAYPRVGERAYLYLGAGWSPSGLFPETRFGAEAFSAVGRGMEASAGFRHLRFEARDLTLYTGALGWYPRGYYVAARPFLSRHEGELLASGNLLVRRYLGEDDLWVALLVGGGEVPGEQVTAFELERLRSAYATLDGRLRVAPPLGVRWSAGYEWEQLPGDRRRGRATVGVGLEARF